MTIFRNITELGKGIAARHGWPAAKAFKAYAMTEADRAALSHCAIELLSLFPPVAGASVLMSAALAVMLERRMQAPVQVVAGTLAVDGAPVFGNRQPLDGAALFADANPAWDGHAWVMVGPYVADVALFRAAYAAWGPARLARHVDLVFGPNKGLYVDRWAHTGRQGLSYEPQYVLGTEEVTRQMGAAFHLIKAARGA